MTNDKYRIELKYRMSGLRLLSVMAAESRKNREVILDKWFQNSVESEDELCADIYRITESGICSGKQPEEIMGSMIDAIPAEEIYRPDIAGCTFRAVRTDKSYERVFKEELNKYKFVKVYEGLLPGNEYDGQSFADLAYGYEPSKIIRIMEEDVSTGSMILWGKILSQMSDKDISILSTGMSRAGRFLLLGGLSDERVHNVIKEAVLMGRIPHADADSIAEKVITGWRL